MNLQLEYHFQPDWPRLAWLAECRPKSPAIRVYHGSHVERETSWFCEAVWDQSYEDGGFDRTDRVFGSGGRLREGSLTFVSSAATVDRLHTISVDGATWVSNSLACLLASAEGQVDVTYENYYEDFESITLGIQRYKRSLPTSAGPVQLIYFKNVAWDGQTLAEREKPNPTRDFRTFSAYRTFLEEGISQIASNMAAGGRRFPYRLLATISSGYDSPAVAVVARKAGLEDTISFTHGRYGLADDGADLGRLLGLNVTLVSRDAWRTSAPREVPFLGADAKGEDVHFAGAEQLLRGSVLLTAYHGGSIWNKDAKLADPDLTRGDQSGLSLTEFRLSAGFLHVPVPFMGVRQVRDINAIGRSPEMTPWDVGGNYNRPVPRRILEEAGVPRGRFAASKRAASMLFFESDSFLAEESLSEFDRWLTQHEPVWTARGKTIPRVAAKRFNRRKPLLRVLAGATRVMANIAPSALGWRVRGLHRRISEAGREEYLFRYVFPWALEWAKQRYPSVHLSKSS